MKPFHYHEDPMYAAAAAILAGQTVTEDASLEEADKFASLLGKRVLHGSPGYPTKEVIASVSPHQTKKGSFEVEFKSGAFDVLSQGELNDLMNGVEVFYKSPHGGRSVIELQEEESVDLEEGVEDIAAAVANYKKGDKTNFGVVTDVSSTSISFKAKDLPITKIAFNQRKMGSKDFVLDKLVKLKEGVELEEAVNWDFIQSMYVKDAIDVLVPLVLTAGAATYLVAKNAIKDYISDKKKNKAAEEDAAVLKKAIDKISKDSAASELADQIKEIPYKKRGDNSQRLALVKKYRVRLKSLLTPDEYSQLNDIYNETIREGVELEEAKGSYDMGTATITAPGNKLHGKQVSIFHKFDDGRLNVQYAKSDKKGDVLNLTLKKDQYKLD